MTEVVFISAIGIALSAAVDLYLDRLTEYDFIQTAIYMIPVGFAAWAAGLRIGLMLGTAAVIAEVWISFHFLYRREPQTLVLVFCFEYITMSTGAFLMARMRYILEAERRMARKDHLTGVSNSRAFWEDMEIEVERMKRDERPLTIIFVDVDDFKKVNDTIGHKGGDEVLRCVGQSLCQLTRAADVVARIGGDEFAVLLPGAEQAAGWMVVERLRDSVARGCSAGMPITLSIGIATFQRAPETAEAMLHVADLLMYEAKESGKNRVSARVF